MSSGASDNSAMTAYVPYLPFSVAPLITEAKRRMKQRRLLVGLLVIALVGGAAGATLALRSPNHASALKRMTCILAPGPRRPIGVRLQHGSIVRLKDGLRVWVLLGTTCGPDFRK